MKDASEKTLYPENVQKGESSNSYEKPELKSLGKWQPRTLFFGISYV